MRGRKVANKDSKPNQKLEEAQRDREIMNGLRDQIVKGAQDKIQALDALNDDKFAEKIEQINRDRDQRLKALTNVNAGDGGAYMDSNPIIKEKKDEIVKA